MSSETIVWIGAALALVVSILAVRTHHQSSTKLLKLTGGRALPLVDAGLVSEVADNLSTATVSLSIARWSMIATVILVGLAIYLGSQFDTSGQTPTVQLDKDCAAKLVYPAGAFTGSSFAVTLQPIEIADRCVAPDKLGPQLWQFASRGAAFTAMAPLKLKASYPSPLPGWLTDPNEPKPTALRSPPARLWVWLVHAGTSGPQMFAIETTPAVILPFSITVKDPLSASTLGNAIKAWGGVLVMALGLVGALVTSFVTGNFLQNSIGSFSGILPVQNFANIAPIQPTPQQPSAPLLKSAPARQGPIHGEGGPKE